MLSSGNTGTHGALSINANNKWKSPSHWKFLGEKEYLRRYSSFFVFTEMTRISLNHLLHHTRTMLLHKNVRFVAPKTGEICSVPFIGKLSPVFPYKWKAIK